MTNATTLPGYFDEHRLTGWSRSQRGATTRVHEDDELLTKNARLSDAVAVTAGQQSRRLLRSSTPSSDSGHGHSHQMPRRPAARASCRPVIYCLMATSRRSGRGEERRTSTISSREPVPVAAKITGPTATSMLTDGVWHHVEPLNETTWNIQPSVKRVLPQTPLAPPPAPPGEQNRSE